MSEVPPGSGAHVGMRIIQQRADMGRHLVVESRWVKFVQRVHRALAYDVALIAQRLQQDGHCFIAEEPAHIAQYRADDILRWMSEMRQHAIMRLCGFKLRETINRLHDNGVIGMIEVEEVDLCPDWIMRRQEPEAT